MDIQPYIERARAACERARASYARCHQYVSHDIWHIGKPGEAIPEGFLVKQLRVGILLFKGMFEESLLLRASALTFTTLLFLVPFLVFMFSFIQTFNLGDHIYGQVSDWIDGHITKAMEVVQVVKGGEEDGEPAPADLYESPEPVIPRAESEGDPATAQAANAAIAVEGGDAVDAPEGGDSIPTEDDQQLVNDILKTMFPTMTVDMDEGEYFDPVGFLVGMVEERATDVRTLGLTGLMYVLITVLGLMRNVEWAFNQIWGVSETRKLLRTLSDYVMITLLLPVVAAVMLGITAALTTNESLGSLSIVLRGSQVLIISLTFALLYYFVPNTTVQPRCALAGGLLAGIAWTATAWAYVTFNVGLAKYTFFFSAFALVPMLLAWIYVSWAILLFGALVTFAYQNEKTFALERLAGKASFAYREAVAVRIMIAMARRYAAGQPALSAADMAESWNVPTRLVHDALETLSKAGLVSVCATEPATYLPSRAADTIAVVEVLNALREAGEDPSALRSEDAYEDVYAALGAPGTDIRSATIAGLAAREA
ncbi:MAG: YihY family inner membrane protein [Candidatus Hydrogenedentes bacterium]|nr:YihY family inner membrane protein [Candidatus Hydrogenedentota bacterium]